MTRFEADAPDERRALVAEAVAAHRKRASEAARFEAEDGPTVEYADRVLVLSCDDGERERLDHLLDDFPVFKVAQPETRKDDAVHVSAIADPKHAADFVDRLFRDVYDLPADYRLWVTRI